MSSSSRRLDGRFRLGRFDVDPDRYCLSGPEGESRLEPKVMAVLVTLGERFPDVVTRDELIDTVWATEVSGDESLTRAISQLRKMLDASPDAEHIETIPRRGYRLLVAPEAAEDGSPPEIRTLAPRAAAVVFIGLIVVVALWRGAQTSPADGSMDAARSADSIEAAVGSTAKSRAAREAFLQAKALIRDGSPENLSRAMEYLDEALVIEPDNADAWAAQAMAYLNIILTRPVSNTHNEVVDPPSRLRTIQHAIRHALALDGDHIEARLAKATVDYRVREASLLETEAAYRALLAAAPEHPNVNMRMGMLMAEVGRLGESLQFHRRAYELDPLSLLTHGFYVCALYAGGYFGQARAEVAQLGHQWRFAPLLAFRLAIHYEDYASAHHWIEQTREQGDPRFSALMERIVDHLESNGSVPSGVIEALRRGMEEHWINVYDGAQMLAEFSDLETQDGYAQSRVGKEDYLIRSLLFKPGFKRLRRTPHVMALFEDLGLLDYWQETGHWPDFCEDPQLGYDCRQAANALAVHSEARTSAKAGTPGQ